MTSMDRIPLFLYRTFDKKYQANAFINHGHFRLGLLDNYHDTDSMPRQDPHEGEVNFPILNQNVPVINIQQQKQIGFTKGTVYYSAVSLNPTYILCASGPEVTQAVRNGFGRYTIKINNPQRLLADITNYFQNRICGIAIKEVQYTRNMEIYSIPKAQSNIDKLPQKAQKYSNECEYRYEVIRRRPHRTNAPTKYLCVHLHRRLAYLEKCW